MKLSGDKAYSSQKQERDGDLVRGQGVEFKVGGSRRIDKLEAKDVTKLGFD